MRVTRLALAGGVTMMLAACAAPVGAAPVGQPPGGCGWQPALSRLNPPAQLHSGHLAPVAHLPEVGRVVGDVRCTR